MCLQITPVRGSRDDSMQRDVRVCFDLVEFLTYHMREVGISEQDARDLSRAMRMADTRHLKHMDGIVEYLEARDMLTDVQRNKLLQLVLEVSADPAYGSEQVQSTPLVLSTRPCPSNFTYNDLFTCCTTVVQATRRLL